MLTRLEPKFPDPTGDPKKDYFQLVASISEFFRSLNAPNVLAIEQADINNSSMGTGTSGAAAGSFTTLAASGASTLAAVAATTVAASGKVDTATYLEFGTGTTLFSKSNGALGVGSDLDCTGAVSAIVYVRQNTDGGVAIVSVDIGLGTITEVSDPTGVVTVGADPGVGANQLWVTQTGGNTIRVRNRYIAAKNVGVMYLMFGGTPA